MNIIKAGYSILAPDLDNPATAGLIYRMIELAGRTCYKSENHITDESAERFVRDIVAREHEAMLEHVSMTVRFVVDRGVSHELVRHRLVSFAQESTRYCNYSKDRFGKEITVIEPVFFRALSEERKKAVRNMISGVVKMLPNDFDNFELEYARWYDSCASAEKSYFSMMKFGATAQEARCVLPNSLKTEVVMTANMREWRHFLKLRAAGTTGAPHPQMLEVTIPLLNELRMKLPALFEDIHPMKGTCEDESLDTNAKT